MQQDLLPYGCGIAPSAILAEKQSLKVRLLPGLLYFFLLSEKQSLKVRLLPGLLYFFLLSSCLYSFFFVVCLLLALLALEMVEKMNEKNQSVSVS